jgi:pimeloyl-ACP methyl ester carboxylesterase
MTFERRSYDLPAGKMSAVHFGRTSNPLKLVFLHSTGFNALAYRALLEPLGVHAVALDLRGHGMSELPTEPKKMCNWHIFRDDVSFFVDRYVDQPIVLSGHSSGAVTAFLAAAQRPEKVSGLVAFDPPTMPLIVRLFPYIPGGRRYTARRFPIARSAGRRRSVFPDLEAAFKRYDGRGTFKGLSDEMLWDYLKGGFKPHPDGMELTCHPLWEQAVFLGQGHNIFKAAQKAPENTKLIYAGKNAPSTRGTRKAMARILGAEKVEFRPEFEHFFPLLDLDYSQKTLSDMLAVVSLQR